MNNTLAEKLWQRWVVQLLVDLLPSNDKDLISDWYHSFIELYGHRMTLFQALCNTIEMYDTDLWNPSICWKSKLHSDWTMFDNMFVAWIWKEKWNTITYHIHISFWDSFRVQEIDNAPEWDWHTSEDVLFLLSKI